MLESIPQLRRRNRRIDREDWRAKNAVRFDIDVEMSRAVLREIIIENKPASRRGGAAVNRRRETSRIPGPIRIVRIGIDVVALEERE